MPNKKKLYQALKAEGYDNFADESAFNAYVDNADNRKKLFSALKAEGYDNFADEKSFDEYLGYSINQPEDDAVFEANAERFRNGQPTEKVTTQSMIDAHPELGLQTNAVQPEAPKWNVPQYDWRPDKQKKLDELSNSTTATPVQDQYGNEYYPIKPREVAYDEAVRGLKDISERKAETKSRLQAISNDVSNELNRLQGQVSVSDLDKFRPANLQSMPVNPVNQELMPEYTALRKAQRLVEESNNIIEEASKKGNTNFMAGLARGFWDNLNAEDYTFGADDAAQSAFLYRALDKAEKGETLTKAEETLLDSAAINMAVQSYYAQDLGKGYGAGQVTAESLPFMLEMAINPISASGKTTAKALLKYGLKKFAKNKAAKVGARLAGDALAATGMAATTGFGDVLEGTTDRLAQNYNYQLDDEGRLHVEKKDDTMGMGEAFARSFATRAIENQSEMIFKAFEPIGGFMKGVQNTLPGGVNKFFDLLSNNKVTDAYRWLKNSKVFRNYLVKDIRNATQIGGLGEEYLEEVYNNIANAAIGEMSWEDVVNLDKNIDTLLGLAPTQVMFGLLGLGGAGATRYQTRRTLEDLQATMNEQQRKELEGLLDMGLDAKEVDVRGFIRNVMQNEGYTIENKRDLIKAAFTVAKQNGIDELTEADTIDKVNAENALIDSVTDPSTGVYAEMTATLPNGEGGNVPVKGYVVGWMGKDEKRQPIFLPDGLENTYENRRVLKPEQWEAEAIQEMPAEEVKVLNEEMIREEEAVKAENEARWNPNVPEPQEGVSFFNGEEEVTIVGVDANTGGLFVAPSEEYRSAQGNEKKMAELVNGAFQLGAIPVEQYKDAMTQQIEAEEKASKVGDVKIENDQQVVRNGETYTVISVDADGIQYKKNNGETNKVPVDVWKSWVYDQKQTEAPTNAVSGESVGESVGEQVNAPVNNVTSGENVGEQVNDGVNVPVNNENVKPKQPTLEEVVATLPKTKNDEIDYKAMTPQQQFQYTSLSESPEVALEDLQADITAGQEEIAKVQEQLSKARGGQRAELRDKIKKLTAAQNELQSFYESVAPKQETQSEEQVVEPVKYAAEETVSEEKPVVVETEKPKKANKPRLTNRKKQKQSEFTDEELQPMDALEFAASNLAAGNVTITTESFKKETGYGEAERKKFMGLLRTPEKGGMTIEEAAEKLVSLDNEGNGRFFGGDTQAARNTIIELLGYEKWGDVTGLIKNNRLAERKKREEAEYAEYEDYIMQAFNMSVADYESMKEYDEQNNPFPDVSEEEYFAKFAEKAEEYNNYLNSYNNDQGRTIETSRGSDSVLSPERAGDIGGNQGNASQRSAEGIGSESVYDSETPQESTSGSEVDSFIERAKEWEAKTGVGVRFAYSLDEVTNKEAREQISNGVSIAGWYEKSTGEVVMYLPNITSLEEVDKTYVHEVVVHKGLSSLLGDKYDKFLDEVWDMMSVFDKAKYINYPGVASEATPSARQRAAADEYIANTFESIDVEESAWGRITELIKRFLKAIGLEPRMTNADIANAVKASYANLKSGAEGGAVGEGTRFSAKKKRALETVSTSRKKHQQTVISSADGAKILNNLDNLAEKYENDTHTKEKTFIGEVAKAIEARKQGSGSQYATFETVNGNVVTIRLADHNATVSNFDNRDENEGISIVVSAKDNNGITNDGDAHIVEYFYDSIDLRRADGKPLAEIVKSIKQSLYSGEYKDTTGLAERQEVNESRFRVVNDKNGKKTLIGLHNISEAKLKKAIKQGGLANPSVAVIDMDKQSHVDYGDITLVLPESMIDKKSGKNVGTYMADAYTPIYPTVVKQMTDKGYKAFNKSLDDVNEFFRSKVRSYFNSYLDTDTIYDALYYWYLSDTGKNPPTLEAALPSDFTREEVDKVKSINPEADSFFQLSEEDKQKALSLYAEKFYNGIEAYKEYLADYIKRMQEVVKDESKPAMVRNRIQKNLSEIENYGFEYDYVAAYYNRGMLLASRQSKPSDVETFSNARNEVVKKGLNDEFNQWLANKESDLGVEEKLFKGYDNQGRAKYVPNTLENASKLMKKEGRAGATGYGGFNEFVAVLAPVAKTTKELNKKKQNLSTKEAYDEFVEQWSGHYHDLAQKLQPGADKWADYGYHRLQEIAPMANPRDYVKREYGIELSEEFMKDLNDIKTAIKNDFPARYFETKFERPVYLNEFVAAVVPQGTSKDVLDALTGAGLPVEEYESGNNEARMAAIDKVSSEIEGTRFRISEKGKQIQAEVDKFTEKYNSRPVYLLDLEMTNEELDAIIPTLTVEELKEAVKGGKKGFYSPYSDKIYIFVDNQSLDEIEESLFHENTHAIFHGSEIFDAFDKGSEGKLEVIRESVEASYPEKDWAEELFACVSAHAMENGYFEWIDKYLPEELKDEYYKKIGEFGYDKRQESRRRTEAAGSSSQSEEVRSAGNSNQDIAESDSGKTTTKERKERLKELFGKVADMGLEGVLENKAYTSMMVDIYKALPEAVRTEIADDAIRLYGGSVVPAVSDYIGVKSKESIIDKIVTIVRQALRKVGFDLDLNANEVRYMAWRSKKPLDRKNLLEVAEDIDMKNRLKVGEYDGTTPDGGGTRFSVKSKPKTKAELKEEVRDLKEDVRSLKDEVRDLKKQVNTLRSGNKDEWEKKQRAIVSFIKGRLTKEAGSVLGKTRLDQLLTLVNKASTATDLHKPLQFIEQVINDASIEHAAAKMDKLIKTKLQGETNRGVAKGIVVDEATRRLFDSIRGTFKDLIATSIDSELRSVRGEILRFGKEINALPEDDIQGRTILTARQEAMKERRKELEKEQEELQRQNVTDTKESLERRHDELVEAMDAHIEGNGVWTQEMQDEYDSIPLRLKLAEIRESQAQLDAILADAIMTRRNAYQNTGETRKKMLAEADVLESNYTIAQEELIRLMNEVSSELSAIINEGKSRLATRRQALAERRRAIVTMGISAIKDKEIKDPNAILSRKEKFDKWFDNSWLKSVSDFMTAPLNSFNFMLKYIDRNHTIGEGELYNHFMKSEEGALEANNRLYDGLKAYNTAIEEKAKEIFGKDIEAVMKDSGKEHIGEVHKQYMYDSRNHKEGDMFPISITKGQAFYVWLTWRQDDGRAKLLADGWNDQSIEEIEALIGEDYIKFGEWVTDEFFPMLREEKYNKTHIDMFGTSMAKREHYFPFKVKGEDIQEKGEMGESYSGMPSTITGNIIKRTINKSRINTEQNAFDLLFKYGNDMETWNAMAKLRQDLNFLHSSKAFRNYLDANSKGLFDKFIKSAEVAVKAYNNSEKDAINDFFAKLNRTWAGTNIGFRLNTAMKQILSYPAFMAYSGNLKYQGYLMKYMLNWVGNYKWAKENLPAFRNRVESGDMGMTGMTDPSFDLGKAINKFGEWGMIPNQLVDALTCAAGARSVYDFEYNRAIKAGMSEEEARNIAQYNAEVAFNETQQSSRDEFVSPTQVSRNVLIKSMMNYQNSNVGYQRMGNEGLLEIMRAKHVYEQDIKNGMSEDEAKKKVANSVIRGTRKMMIAFTILPGLWYLGGRGIVGITASLISSLFGGGDDDEPYLDDEAKEGLMLSMALGTVAGTSGGQAIASVVQGREYEPMAYVKEFTKIIADAVKDGFNLNTTKNIALKMAKFGGVNIETFENIYLGVEHAIRTGNFDLVDFMFLINLPPSQRKKMAEELYSDMPFMEYAEKVSRAQKLFDDYRKNLPYAKGDKNGSKTNAIKKQYVIENLSDDKQDKLEKEKEFKKLQREYNSEEDKAEWLEDNPEYTELEKNFKGQEVTKEVNRKAKELK